MGLTTGTGPFGSSPAGRIGSSGGGFKLVEPLGRRVRAVRDNRVVVDSEETSLVHLSGSLPRYSFPRSDVHVDAEDDPEVDGNVIVGWADVDAWFEEDERVLVHPRDPYHRIDTFSTSRRVRAVLGDVELASTSRARALYETGLPVRWYMPRANVRMELLERSPTATECPYKGTAHYWTVSASGGQVTDAAWSYEDEVRREGQPVQWLIAFDDTKVAVQADAGGGARR